MKSLFGIDEARVVEIARRHALKFEALHRDAMIPMADDPDVDVSEMIAVAKWQLVSGVYAMCQTHHLAAGVPLEAQRREVDAVIDALFAGRVAGAAA